MGWCVVGVGVGVGGRGGGASRHKLWRCIPREKKLLLSGNLREWVAGKLIKRAGSWSGSWGTLGAGASTGGWGNSSSFAPNVCALAQGYAESQSTHTVGSDAGPSLASTTSPIPTNVTGTRCSCARSRGVGVAQSNSCMAVQWIFVTQNAIISGGAVGEDPRCSDLRSDIARLRVQCHDAGWGNSSGFTPNVCALAQGYADSQSHTQWAPSF